MVGKERAISLSVVYFEQKIGYRAAPYLREHAARQPGKLIFGKLLKKRAPGFYSELPSWAVAGTRGVVFMACRVRYLKVSEFTYVKSLASKRWPAPSPSTGCCTRHCSAFRPQVFPIEIDALVVMDDGVLLLELKDYNGKLTSNGDQRVLNDRPRGRSAVDLVSEKERKVKGILGSTVQGFSKYPVDTRVVLTGSAEQ